MMICVEINQCVGATTRRACWLGRVVRPLRHAIELISADLGLDLHDKWCRVDGV